MVKANCLIDIPQEVEKLNPGDAVTVQILSANLWDREGGQPHTHSGKLSCC